MIKKRILVFVTSILLSLWAVPQSGPPKCWLVPQSFWRPNFIDLLEAYSLFSCAVFIC